MAIPSGLAEATIKAATHVAGGQAMSAGAVPASTVQLAQGVIRMMTLTKLKIALIGVFAVGIVTSGIALLAMGQTPTPPGPGAATAAPLAPIDEKQQTARRQSIHNLRMISLAMHNAINNNAGRFPAAAISKDGKPILSWRVALLPYLGEKGLFDKFHLDEPWDSAHNKALLHQMPTVYVPVLRKGEPKDSTYYQVPVGQGTLFGDDQGTRYDDVTDERATTLMVVEGAKPVPWTKPEDIPFDSDLEKPLPKLGGQFEDGFHVAFADGAVVSLSKTIDPDLLRALMTRNGGEQIKPERLSPKDPQQKN